MVAASRGVGKAQTSAGMDRPGPLRLVGERQADVVARVVGEVQVVFAEGPRQPFRYADERRAVNVAAICAGEHIGRDNRIVRKTADDDAGGDFDQVSLPSYLQGLERAAFICGCGHSGTTLVATILSAHPRIYVPLYESEAFLGTE